MMSLSAIKSAASAGHYFENDDYYVDGLSPSEWVGAGAEALGLQGEVDRETFRSLLAGRLPGGQQVGIWRDGELKHQPGTDLTFSAPKSVSILAEVGGDQRLFQAHDAAVTSTLKHIEKEYIVTRNRNRTEATVVYEKTGSIVAATFKHTTSRALDPQLHTHCVMMNLTQRADGEWRSTENKPVFINQKHLGLIYRQFLAEEVKSAGYEVAYGKDGTFEIAGLDREVIREFSKRSEAIEAALVARGTDRESATAAEREVATLDTRDRKVEADRGELLDRWNAEVGGNGRQHLVDLITSSHANQPSREGREAAAIERIELANAAVNWAAEHLGERDTSWSREELVKTANRYGGARFLISDVETAIDAAMHDGALISKTVKVYDRTSKEEREAPGFTTKLAVDLEDQMIKIECQGRGRASPFMSAELAQAAIYKAEQQSNSAGYEWNDDQKKSTLGILTTRNRIVGLQGFAGTAKTNSVLRTVAETAVDLGYTVKGMAPTNSAAHSLLDGAGIPSSTIQSHLGKEREEWIKNDKARRQIDKIEKQLVQIGRDLENPGLDAKTGLLIPENSPLYQKRVEQLQYERSQLQGERKGLRESLEKKPELWIVDESSMIGTKLMTEMLIRASQAGAKLVLTGDVRQLASVEAGASFRQLQAQGMETHLLEEIVRQTNQGTRDAVYLSLMKNARSALARLEESGSQINEMNVYTSEGGIDHAASGEARRNELVSQYLSLTPDARAKSLILEPSREGRELTNDLVRKGLKVEGRLINEIEVTRLVSADSTEAERRIVATYKDGQVVRFARNYKREGIKQGEYYIVSGREGDSVLLQPYAATESFEPTRYTPARYAPNNVQIFNSKKSSLAEGEKIVWRENDKKTGKVNNAFGLIERIEGTAATIRLSNGSATDFDMSRMANSHWDHGYAMTVHAAQGKTSENVFIHAETFRDALLNQEQFYVQISRAKQNVFLYTDSRNRLVRAVEQRTGQKQAAKEERFVQMKPLDHLLDKLWSKPEPAPTQHTDARPQLQPRDRGGIELNR